MIDSGRDPGTPAPPSDVRTALHQQLHLTYEAHAFDNWRVWAGHLAVNIDGLRFRSLARAYVGPGRPSAWARLEVERFIAAVDPTQGRSGDVAVRGIWRKASDSPPLRNSEPDAQRESEGPCESEGHCVVMELLADSEGRPLLTEHNNLRFQSLPFQLERSGVFTCTVQFSADPLPIGAAQKDWIGVDRIAQTPDLVIVVSPAWVADGPSVLEVCVRKTGASIGPDGRFRSGRFTAVTAQLEGLPGHVVYLLPFFKPGFYDLHTGADVRKGKLGSPYAAADFFTVDGERVTPPEEADLAALVAADLLHSADVQELWGRVPHSPECAGPQSTQPACAQPQSAQPAAEGRALDTGAPSLEGLVRDGAQRSAARWGRERLLQLVGRAELRALTRRAHELGKRVIFDLVLLQTSRDHPLIGEHPEWYVRGDDGRPSIHRIAWLEYSDVALFDLSASQPLQEYLLAIAPYWIERCGLDGVRIDASQTVDRPFLMRIKNRINAVKQDALVLGETLCPLEEAVDVPVDMVYALMVDHHRDAEQAAPIIDLLEEMNTRFAAGTVALAYFENHDSPRATQIWYERFAAALTESGAVRQYWSGLVGQIAVAGTSADGSSEEELEAAAVLMSLLKNLQASIIDATAGTCAVGTGDGRLAGGELLETSTGTNLAFGLEMGSDWGERRRTDFENEALLDERLRAREPNTRLVRAYAGLERRIAEGPEIRRGRVYFHRNQPAGGPGSDRVLAYTRYDADGAVLVLHNLDCREAHSIACSFEYLSLHVKSISPLLDTYQVFGLETGEASVVADGSVEEGFRASLRPLQTRGLRLGVNHGVLVE